MAALNLKVCMEGVGLLFHHSKVCLIAFSVFVPFCRLLYMLYDVSNHY